MRIKYYYFKKFFIILVMFINFSIYSQEIKETYFYKTTYVFCAKKYLDWKWLTENNEKVIVEGEWVHYENQIQDNRYLFTSYFKLNGGIIKLNELKAKCILQFGNEYKYAQPATGFFSEWYLFGMDNGIVFDGIFTIFNRCRNCFYRGNYDFDRKFISYGLLDLKEFIINYNKTKQKN